MSHRCDLFRQTKVTPAASGVLQFLALAGLTLTASEGVEDRVRLEVLIKEDRPRGDVLGNLGDDSVLHAPAVGRQVPAPVPVDGHTRGGRTRRLLCPSATATHPLEFGTVAAMTIPLAVARARSVADHRLRWWICVGLIVLGAMMTLSRSALIGTALGLVVPGVAMAVARQVASSRTGCSGLGAVVIAIPGLVGTLRGLFWLQQRPQRPVPDGRLSLCRRDGGPFPWFGKGYGTFLPRYWILDNGFLNFLVSTGALGVTAFLGLLGAAFYSARSASRQTQIRRYRETSQALLAASVAGASAVVFFDIFAFPQAAGMLFLFLVCAARHIAYAGMRPPWRANSGRGGLHECAPRPALGRNDGS